MILLIIWTLNCLFNFIYDVFSSIAVLSKFQNDFANYLNMELSI